MKRSLPETTASFSPEDIDDFAGNPATVTEVEMYPNHVTSCCAETKQGTVGDFILSDNSAIATDHDNADNEKMSIKPTSAESNDTPPKKTMRERLARQLAQPSASWKGLAVSASWGPAPQVLREWKKSAEAELQLPAPGCTLFVHLTPEENDNCAMAASNTLLMNKQNYSSEWCHAENLVLLAKQKILQDVELLTSDDKDNNQFRLKRSVQQLILNESDSHEDKAAAAGFYKISCMATPEAFAEEQQRLRDDACWEDQCGVSLLRRLAGGLDFIVVPPTQANNSVVSDDLSLVTDQLPCPWTVQNGAHVGTIDLSFLDILLQSDKLHQVVINATVRRLVKLERLKQTLDAETSGKSKQLCGILQERLIQILNRTQGTFRLPDRQNLDVTELKAGDLPLLCTQLTAKKQGNPWSFSGHAEEEMLELQQERERIVSEYEHRMVYERTRRKARRIGRLQDGTLLYTADDLTVSAFMDRAHFMERVNQSIERSFNPAFSRPMFKELNLTQSSLSELQRLFFNPDGSLREDIVPDIDMSRKHGYINFSNSLCSDPRNDKRWQVPFRQHTSVMGQTRSRGIVESILARECVINPAFEVIHDLGLLIGGTEDQSLHHDIARQTTMWASTRPSVDSLLDSYNPATGWEIDRLEYNEAMSNSCAPCSVLLSLGDSDLVRIGVQRGQIVRCGPDRNKCSVINGVPDEELDIIQEDDFLVVVSARGCIFTGDFPHAGVQNFGPNSEEAYMMKDLIQKVDLILAKHSRNHLAGVKAVASLLSKFPGLNKLCRMHCSTELLDADMRIPRNAIGFFDCFANPPKNTSGQLDLESKTMID